MQYLTQDDSYEKTVRTWGGRRGWQGKNCILSVVSHAVNTVKQLKAGEVRTSLKKNWVCAQEATSAKRSTAVQSRGALLNEVLRYTNARAWGRE